MKDAAIVEKIEEFGEFLSIGTVISDMVRWLGWVFVKGLAFIVDGLENVTDDVLLVKQFFQNPEIATFVDTIRPFLYILLAFSLLYTGYLLIFQKKFDREGMAMNLFIALAIVVALSQGMGKANEFTDDAIDAINTTELYDEGEGSLSDNIISRQLTDLLEFDKKEWETTELDPPNTLPLSMIGHLSVTEKLDGERTELELTPQGQDIVSHKLTWSVSEKELVELEDSTLMPWTNEFYYRYDINWLTLLTTLAVMAFTLFSIAYKLARLSFELTFNYILALLVAPADIHDGQKTKKIMQSILNTFLVIILIFLSMKIYMIGTAYVAAELEGLAYLIALIAFSVAVIDGPNIVERLFGIDAGLKNGWGVLAGAYAGGKLISGAGGAVMNTMSRSTGASDSEGSEKGNGQGEKSAGHQNKNGAAIENAVSPNDGETKGAAQTGLAGSGIAAGSAIAGGAADKKGIEKNDEAPSPNHNIELSKGNRMESTELNEGAGNDDAAPGNVNSDKASSSDNEKSPQEPSQAAGASGGHIPSPNDLEGDDSSTSGVHARPVGSNGSVPSPNDADRTSGGSSPASAVGNIQDERMEQRTAGQSDDETDSINEQAEGNSAVHDSSVGNSSSGPSAAASPNADNLTTPSSAAGKSQNDTHNAPSGRQQSTNSVNRSGGDQAIDEEVIVNDTQGTTTQGSSNVSTNTSGASNTSAAASPNTGNAAVPSSAGGQSRNETSSAPSGRQQSTTTINRSGGDQTIDENVMVNETQGNTTQGARNVTSNTSGASGAGGFNSGTPAASGASSTLGSGSSRTINQDSASRENIVNETTVNRNHQHHTDQTNVNDIRRPHTHNLNQEGSSTIDRIKNYRRGR
ncbi:pLS20_p028 family conjugation system transmembrane protein [Planococcus sp. ISL-109]|uniref:pLS20_p028 family conjugation system transmembrane protein n=1 Tax=Planococcus sp. ISL-109 TaxID=2819166 RepID=UPI001BEC8A32|nr:hypothetical protein [Planococcus sp. ISL-109]MBT2583132.1 hypothetical protein [Planococcus sp. ISL-109]